MAITAQQAVNQFCLNCQDGDVWSVANCAKVGCALHPVRPNRALQGKTPEDYDVDELKQSVLDALEFGGLQEKRRV